MSEGPAAIIAPTPSDLAPVLERLHMPAAVQITRMDGGSNAVFRIDLADKGRINLKTYDDLRSKAPAREARAAERLAEAGLPVTRYLLLDESCEALPYRFALTTHLPGMSLDLLKGKADLTDAYRQMGALLRRVHNVPMPAYGPLDDEGVPGPHATNVEFIDNLSAAAFESFLLQGGDPELADRLRRAVSENMDLARHSAGPVFAHDDFQPGNVLAEMNGGEHDAYRHHRFRQCAGGRRVVRPGEGHVLHRAYGAGRGGIAAGGYGPLDHSDPQRALWPLHTPAPGHHVVLAAPDRRHCRWGARSAHR
jgi:hypothetical protein